MKVVGINVDAKSKILFQRTAAFHLHNVHLSELLQLLFWQATEVCWAVLLTLSWVYCVYLLFSWIPSALSDEARHPEKVDVLKESM